MQWKKWILFKRVVSFSSWIKQLRNYLQQPFTLDKNKDNEWGIKSRVLFLTLVPTIIISLLLSAYFTSTRIQDLEIALADRGYAIALQLAPASEYGVFSGNINTLQRLANDALSEPEVHSVSVFNLDGRLLAHAGHEHKTPTNILSVADKSHGITMADTGHSLLFTVPVIIRDVIIEDYAYSDSPYDMNENHDNVIGWITLELGRMTTTIRQYQVLFAGSIIVLIGLCISSIFAFRMGQDVTKPILQMVAAVEKIKNGNFDTRIYTNARSELRHLEAGINTMAASLKAAHEEMQQSVDQATADVKQTCDKIEMQNIELDMARKEAETASRIKSEFLANMSHEIRTPLNGVIGFINLLVKTKLDARQKDYLSTIQKSATSLLSIINDILDFSKIEAGKLMLNQEPMAIRDCVEDALTLLTPAAHEKKLELILVIFSDIPEKIIGDHLRIRQIITNLVNNAIKFTERGFVEVRVRLEKEISDTQASITISVCDSGIGLTEPERDSLFQAFQQADATTTRRFGGTGLGLVISKRLVQQMKGNIGVDSEKDKGSNFWFAFIADKVQEPPSPIYHPLLNQFRILIVDPHPSTRLGLYHTLTGWEIQVKEVDDATNMYDVIYEAYAKNIPFHMIIIGVNQPELNLTFIKDFIQLAKNKFNCQVGVFVNTTDHAIHDSIHDFEAAFCLAKPVRYEKLHEALVDALIFEGKALIYDNWLEDTPSDISHFTIENNPITILAVDDYPSNLKLVAALLENLGIQTDCATSGKQALEFLKHKNYDLIFMDIQMPEMDGLEVTNRIRLNELPGYHTPIIALTAHALAAEKEAVLSAGMDDYLIKPIDEKELRRVIEQWVQKSINTPLMHSHKNTIFFNASTNTNVPVDWVKALNLAGNNHSLAKDMLMGLTDSLRDAQTKINQSYALKDLKNMREEVHRLHGACCYCGVSDLKSAVSKLETAIIKKEMHIINFLMVEMNKEINRLQQYVQQNKEDLMVAS